MIHQTAHEAGGRQAAPRHIYDKFAAHYDKAFAPLERLFLARWRAHALRVLRTLPPGARILEIGAGTGANLAFYPPQARGAASEISSEMIAVARLKPRSAQVHFVQSPAEELPFADNSFDACVAMLVLCSVASPARVFAEVRRVVRPGGIVSLLEHVRPEGALLGALFDLISSITVPLFDDHFNRRTSDDAHAAGLCVTRIERRAAGIVQFIECRVEK